MSASLPSLSDGFVLHLYGGNWIALFPRHSLMWVSADKDRVREFVRSASSGYERFLTALMRESFAKYYRDPEPLTKTKPFPGGEILSSTVCFLPTNDCNLGCKYCFSNAVPNREGPIPWEVAKAAVDLGVRNAVLQRLRGSKGELQVRFFGGGEPTLYWDSFTRIVEYARRRAEAVGVGVFLGTITNGYLEESKAEWFADNVDQVSVSLDGPPSIQNDQRPTCQGGPSFEMTWSFLSRLDALGVKIEHIRITLTAISVHRMEEIAQFLWDNLSKPYPLQFEPVYLSKMGRQNAKPPNAKDFIEGFRRVEDLALRYSGKVGTTTRPLVIRIGAFCDSLEGRGLFVTPDGYLSLCSEISRRDDPRRDKYFVGCYDRSSGRFFLYPTDDGHSLVRSELPWWCRGCFAQWSCRGGCEPRSRNEDVRIRKAWCQLVREQIRWTWSDVRSGRMSARARIAGPEGEELIWLPIWKVRLSDVKKN